MCNLHHFCKFLESPVIWQESMAQSINHRELYLQGFAFPPSVSKQRNRCIATYAEFQFEKCGFSSLRRHISCFQFLVTCVLETYGDATPINCTQTTTCHLDERWFVLAPPFCWGAWNPGCSASPSFLFPSHKFPPEGESIHPRRDQMNFFFPVEIDGPRSV